MWVVGRWVDRLEDELVEELADRQVDIYIQL